MHIAHNPAPWFADIVNYPVTGQMPLHWGQQDKFKFLSMVKYFSGMILICSSIVPIRSLGGVYLSMTNPMSSPLVMIMLVESTLVLRRPLQRFCSVNFIYLPYSEMLILIAHLVSAARS
jgi:hypothetical protein